MITLGVDLAAVFCVTFAAIGFPTILASAFLIEVRVATAFATALAFVAVAAFFATLFTTGVVTGAVAF